MCRIRRSTYEYYGYGSHHNKACSTHEINENGNHFNSVPFPFFWGSRSLPSHISVGTVEFYAFPSTSLFVAS